MMLYSSLMDYGHCVPILQGLTHEIEEFALIDGANRFQAFLQSCPTSSASGIIATAIFVFHVAWNEYLYASVLTFSSKKYGAKRWSCHAHRSRRYLCLGYANGCFCINNHAHCRIVRFFANLFSYRFRRRQL